MSDFAARSVRRVFPKVRVMAVVTSRAGVSRFLDYVGADLEAEAPSPSDAAPEDAAVAPDAGADANPTD
jgi:hypothetical protein